MLKHLVLTLTLALILAAPVMAQDATPSASGQVDRLRDLVGPDYGPRRAVLSPVGDRIAWQEADVLCLYTIDSASTHCSALPDDFHSVAPQLVWAANGTKIAFTQDFFRFFNEPDLYTYDLKHDLFANLTDDGSHETILKGGENIPNDVLPAWSPRGNLYWWRLYRHDPPTQSVYHFTPSDEPVSIQNLTLLIPGPYSVFQQPAISPDGSIMARPGR